MKPPRLPRKNSTAGDGAELCRKRGFFWSRAGRKIRAASGGMRGDASSLPAILVRITDAVEALGFALHLDDLQAALFEEIPDCLGQCDDLFDPLNQGEADLFNEIHADFLTLVAGACFR